MTRRDWGSNDARTLGVFLSGDELAEETYDGRPVRDDSFIVLFNAHFEDVEMRLPNQSFGREWMIELCTDDSSVAAGSKSFAAHATLSVSARSMVVLRRNAPPRGGGGGAQAA
jgi:glycogen operon protein